nr:serine/threonine-protein kinase CDL1-like [Ipomoea batatas]
MSCFPCFQNNQNVADKEQLEQLPVAQPRELDTDDGAPKDDNKAEATEGGGDGGNSNVKTFNFRELATATKHFKQESLIGESGFGKVFKGTLPDGQAQPIFRDPKRFPEIVDPLLKKAYPMRSLNQAVGVTAMCLQEEATVRPLFDDVIAALSFLAVETKEPLASSIPDPEPKPSEKTRGESSSDDSDGERDDAEDGNNSDKLSFCYSVNMRSTSISESHDGGSPRSNLRQESTLKLENDPSSDEEKP